MGLADDRRHMVLAMGLEPDVLQHHHLVVALGLLEGTLQELDGIGLVALKELLEGAHHAARGRAQALAVGIVACPLDEHADRRLGLGARGPALRPGGAGLAKRNRLRRYEPKTT